MNRVPTYLVLAASLAPTAGLACTMMAPTHAEVRRGEQCAVTYVDTKAPQFVSSSPVVDLGEGIIRQRFSNGGCSMGERLVAYFDCASGTGAWLGGSATSGAPQVPPSGPNDPVVLPEGSDQSFIDLEERRFAPSYRPEAILTATHALPWIELSGPIQSPRMVVDGKRFDLNCGCKLFYPFGVN